MRKAEIHRTTAETEIAVAVDLDGSHGVADGEEARVPCAAEVAELVLAGCGR
jgi:imidazoleglycerol phosphate dehydratase HisB